MMCLNEKEKKRVPAILMEDQKGGGESGEPLRGLKSPEAGGLEEGT